MTEEKIVYEKIRDILTRVLKQTNESYTLRLFPKHIEVRLASITTDEQDSDYDEIFLRKNKDDIYLSYEPKGQLPFIATPEKIAEIIERDGHVQNYYLPKLLGDITNNFVKGIVNAEFEYREQTPWSQQRKDLEEKLKKVISS